jgi:hypothetical protein
MDPVDSIIANLNPCYFWDVNVSGLNASLASRLIIERVFCLGEVHEMKYLMKFYGRKKVVEVLSNLQYIDPKTLNFITKLFHKPPEEFRCYQLQQSRPQHWNS